MPRVPRATTVLVTYGEGMSQEDMMQQDMLVLVDSTDQISGEMSKREAHTFSAMQPRGWLHRAFSCFIFDQEGRMLLTRRAARKITFPGVWTNACCSHPLHGLTPSEVDHGEEAAMPGIKHAARRKLGHELGITGAQIPHEDFRYLGRFHYWAADTRTYGPEAPWGEHEVDYILFFRGEVNLELNPDEVEEARYVTQEELRFMIADENIRWSPWFIGIMERGGWTWWGDLEQALAEKSPHFTTEIVYFDPPTEHWGTYNLDSHDATTGVRQVDCQVKGVSTSPPLAAAG